MGTYYMPRIVLSAYMYVLIQSWMKTKILFLNMIHFVDTETEVWGGKVNLFKDMKHETS